MIFLFGNICYFNNFERPWEFVLIQFVLRAIIVFVNEFKTYYLGQFNIFFCFFLKIYNIVIHKSKYALTILHSLLIRTDKLYCGQTGLSSCVLTQKSVLK